VTEIEESKLCHLQGLLQSISEDGREVSFQQLKKFFFAPHSLYDVGELGSRVRGLVSQSAAAVDAYFTSQVNYITYLNHLNTRYFPISR
jgi:hypothetical protein